MSRRINPERDTAIALYNEGCMLASREQYEAAIDKFEKALQYDPSLMKALHNKALAQQKMGRLQEADSSYERLLEQDPYDPRILNEVAVLKAYLEDLDGALSAMNRLIETGKAGPNVYSNKGVVLMRKGLVDEAEQLLINTVQQYPEYASARYNLATIYAIQENFKNLKAQLLELLELNDFETISSRISKDRDFDKVRSSDQFAEIMGELKSNHEASKN